MRPTRTKQRAAPKGSSIIPRTPFSANSAGAPSMVSEPNQVANKAQAARLVGKRRPAITKSLVVLTLLEAHHPIRTVPNKYRPMKTNKYPCIIIPNLPFRIEQTDMEGLCLLFFLTNE